MGVEHAPGVVLPAPRREFVVRADATKLGTSLCRLSAAAAKASLSMR